MPTTEITIEQTKRAMWLGVKFSDIVGLGLKAAEQQLIENIEKDLAKKLADKVETALADGQKSFDVTIEAKQGQYLATLSTTITIDFYVNGFSVIEHDCIAFGLNNRDMSPKAIEREDIKSIRLYRILLIADDLVQW